MTLLSKHLAEQLLANNDFEEGLHHLLHSLEELCGDYTMFWRLDTWFTFRPTEAATLSPST